MVFVGACGAQGDFARATLVSSLPTYTFGTVGVPTVPAGALTVSALASTHCVDSTPLQLRSRVLEGHAGCCLTHLLDLNLPCLGGELILVSKSSINAEHTRRTKTG